MDSVLTTASLVFPLKMDKVLITNGQNSAFCVLTAVWTALLCPQ